MLDALVAIVAEAGELAAARAAAGFRSWEKSRGHPVCEVDLAVDKLLRSRLGALDPEAGWLSEESKAVPANSGRMWVVDPIDGTRDFIRGRPGWAVSVALVQDGAPLLGVLAAPARGELWAAVRGAGATRNGAPIQCSKRDELAGARIPADTLARTDRLFAAVAKPNGIALRLALVAAGDADLLATWRWGHSWDIAAAVLIAAEAGCRVTDALGRPFHFAGDPKVFGVLAASPGLHAKAQAHFAARAGAAL